MKKFHLFLGFMALFLSISNLFCDPVFVSGLTIKKAGEGKVSVQWKANTNSNRFFIFRNNQFPVGMPLILSNSILVSSNISEGAASSNQFIFPPVYDSVPGPGRYYYLVLPIIDRISLSDFNPNQNYTISPVVISTDDMISPFVPVGFHPEVEMKTNLIVKNIFIKTNVDSILLFWEIDEPDHNFTIYRTTNLIKNTRELTEEYSYVDISGDYYFDDRDIEYGVPYYYTIIVDSNFVVLPGTNENRDAAFVGRTNLDIKVIRDVLDKKQDNLKDFQKKFR